MSAATATPPTSPFTLKSPNHQNHPLKPNPHPYAIKTTSTALLSRSNSSGHAAQASHYYVPPHPNRSPTRSPTNRKSEYRGHQYSTSLTGSDIVPASPIPIPSPLPIPFPFDPSAPRPPTHPIGRQSRAFEEADARGDVAVIFERGRCRFGRASGRLAAYLASALRVRPGDAVVMPVPVVRDIAVWVRESGISGRVFLRWDEEDLEALGVSTSWRKALLNASRTLRQNVLRGRIWGSPPDDGTSAPASHPFASDLRPPLRRTNAVRARKGRVRGMVDKWERESAGSDGEGEMGSPRRLGAVLPIPDSAIDLGMEKVGGEEEEMSMEDLLAGQPVPSSGSWGARAWEDVEGGVTVKKAGEPQGWSTIRRDGVGNGSGSSSGSGSSGRIKMGGTKDERRAEQEEQGEDAVHVSSEEEEKMRQLERALEKEVSESRDLLEAFRRRLVEVEERVQRMEERDAEKDGELERLKESERLREAELARKEAEQAQREVERKKQDVELAREVERLRAVEKSAKEKEFAPESTSTEPALRAQSPQADAGIIITSPVPQYLVPAAERSEMHGFQKNRRPEAQSDVLDPGSVSALPSYVLLVGLGVCAVVLRVVLRRVAGRPLRS
ncbi:hypothetical protein EW146_g2101 [Bondarzewia mesenterica]|uniref:Uncharacterized protein n=1 Tax=Bondarzewia mesenterica TaxID=1095465 RepID=A0A4S4M3X7_9AGAM|nr:hypothetical protein EW146_g2101 [Bondarzewia mesenterica]